jgi:hypothetical protein
MHRTCRITVPGLSIKTEFAAARERVLANFPEVREVLATTAPTTLLVVYSGPAEPDAWYDALVDSVTSDRGPGGRMAPAPAPCRTLGR